MVASEGLLGIKTNDTAGATRSTLDRIRATLRLLNHRDLSAAADDDSAVTDESVSQLFESRLLPMASMREATKNCDKFREIAVAYEADWKTLSHFRSEWMQLLSSLVRIDLSASGELQDAVLLGNNAMSAAWVNELTAGLAWPLNIRSALDASLAPMPISKSREILINCIEGTIRSMAAHMVHQLDVLTERCVIGAIQWFGESACQYTFYDRGLASRTTGSRMVGDIQEDHESKIAWSTHATSVASKKSVAIHIHDVVDTVSSRLGDGLATIPPHVQKIIHNVPTALANDIRMVEGNLIRERCVEQDLEEVNWMITQDIAVPYYDNTVPYYYDPAIVLADRYVLIGWKDDPSAVASPARPHGTSPLKTFWNRIFE